MTSILYQTVFSIILLTTQKKWKKKNIMITKFQTKHFLNDNEDEMFEIE